MFEREEIGSAVLYRGDCLEVMREVSGVDAVLTDPPYSSGGQYRTDRCGKSAAAKYSKAEIDRTPDFSGDNRDQRSFGFWSTLWASLALQSCKPGAVAGFFTDWRQLPTTTDYMQAGGWVWRGIFAWAKRYSRTPFNGTAEISVPAAARPILGAMRVHGLGLGR